MCNNFWGWQAIAGALSKILPCLQNLSTASLSEELNSSGPMTDNAFKDLRQRLLQAPIMTHPDFNRPFILDTDASDVGIGAVLSQVGSDGLEHVIAFGSRLLTKAERQYCVTRKELLAVVNFIQQYRPYLLGREFMQRIDHSSLMWLKNFREPEGQLARWLEKLQECNFTIVHRKWQEAWEC